MIFKRIILFGAGYYGRCAFHQLSNKFHIAYFVDNDDRIAGKYVEGVEVLSFEQFKEINISDYTIIIVSKAYHAIGLQLGFVGVKNYYVMLEGFLYHTDENVTMMPVELNEICFFKKTNDRKSILFVQNTPCIRTNKIAEMMKHKGFSVYLLYTLMSPEVLYPEYASIYDGLFSFSTMDAILRFVNGSDFDIIHCSNEPDILTVILQNSNKPIIHDCHDLSSDYLSMSIESLDLEFIANSYSDGVIYTTKLFRDKVLKKYDVSKERTFVLENYIADNMIPCERLPKISEQDGCIHCVYEGSVSNDSSNLRYFNEVWKKMAENGIIIHFYSTSTESICRELSDVHKNIIYEGKLPTRELIKEMTKYDIGLCIYNVTEDNRFIIDYASVNKLQEYIAAGIPVAASNVESLISVLTKLSAGRYVDFSKDILSQFNEIKGIKVEEMILKKKGLTMDSQAEGLIDFYNSVIQNYKVLRG